MQKRFDPLKHFVWHPCSQMKDYETLAPLRISHAQGVSLFTEDGNEIIDAIGSWWCKSLGHRHPRLQQSLKKQLESFEHTLLAGVTYTTIEQLSQKLCRLASGNAEKFSKVFYASDGSSAVEIAMKMALQYQMQTGNRNKKRFAFLSGAYHGENLLSLSVSDLSLYNSPFHGFVQPGIKLPQHQGCNGTDDLRWHSFPQLEWENIEKTLDTNADCLAGVIVEPIVQGAGGMKFYSPQLLKKLSHWCVENKTLLLADEIMTGFCRTGEMFACEHAGVTPDIMMVMKGLSAGVLPISAVLTTNDIYRVFYDDYSSGKAFMHSNTHSGNALAVAVALETLKIYEEENFVKKAKLMSHKLRLVFENAAKKTGMLKNVRGLGMLAAADISFAKMPARAGYQVYCKAVEKGVLLRPLGNTLYLCPPLIIDQAKLQKIEQVMVASLQSI